MKKHTLQLANGKTVELTDSQAKELERDGMVIVGDRIIRTKAYCERIQKGSLDVLTKTARRLFK